MIIVPFLSIRSMILVIEFPKAFGGLVTPRTIFLLYPPSSFPHLSHHHLSILSSQVHPSFGSDVTQFVITVGFLLVTLVPLYLRYLPVHLFLGFSDCMFLWGSCRAHRCCCCPACVPVAFSGYEASMLGEQGADRSGKELIPLGTSLS